MPNGNDNLDAAKRRCAKAFGWTDPEDQVFTGCNAERCDVEGHENADLEVTCLARQASIEALAEMAIQCRIQHGLQGIARALTELARDVAKICPVADGEKAVPRRFKRMLLASSAKADNVATMATQFFDQVIGIPFPPDPEGLESGLGLKAEDSRFVVLTMRAVVLLSHENHIRESPLFGIERNSLGANTSDPVATAYSEYDAYVVDCARQLDDIAKSCPETVVTHVNTSLRTAPGGQKYTTALTKLHTGLRASPCSANA